jgi:hypothetical protein
MAKSFHSNVGAFFSRFPYASSNKQLEDRYVLIGAPKKITTAAMNMQKKNEEEFIHSPRESTGFGAAADCSECDTRNRRLCPRQLNPVSS